MKYYRFVDVAALIKDKISEVVAVLYGIDSEDIYVECPNDKKWGDYSTNIAFTLARRVKQSPGEIAKNICYEFNNIDFFFEKDSQKQPIFHSIEFATPGFINFKISNVFLLNSLAEIVKEGESFGKNFSFRGQKVLVEYTDPNPFKQFHIGHLMSNTIGESLSRLLEFEGADLKRANYQGDVGIHVAKSIWGMQKMLSEDNISLRDIEKMPLSDRIKLLGKAYTIGDVMYDKNSQTKEYIDRLNYCIFKVAQDYLRENEGWQMDVDYEKFIKEEDKFNLGEIRQIYEKGRLWSLEYFETIYKRLGTKFDFYYFESLAGEYGYKIVREFQEKGVFEKDQGAVILRGEKSGLHTRVFINSLGIPVYEAKELGLAPLKYQNFSYDLSLVVTGNEIVEYFKVLMKALEFVDPNLASKTKHVPHGMLKLKSGKMSSRTGEVILGEALINDVKEAVLGRMDLEVSGFSEDEADEVADQLAVGALKYDVLKQGIGRDIIFDKEKSLSLCGNTGPYLQYTHARACSVLEKALDRGVSCSADSFYVNEGYGASVNEKDIEVIRHLVKFPKSVKEAAESLSPSNICSCLFDVAKSYNAFYDSVPIINADTREAVDSRLYLTSAVKNVLKSGLYLLGIKAPSKI